MMWQLSGGIHGKEAVKIGDWVSQNTETEMQQRNFLANALGKCADARRHSPQFCNAKRHSTVHLPDDQCGCPQILGCAWLIGFNWLAADVITLESLWIDLGQEQNMNSKGQHILAPSPFVSVVIR